jgi:ABC-type multidrug transport system fused ATPase/permease subunit
VISLKDLKFHYPTKKDVQVLKGISINVQQNKVIALVGPSGKLLYN